MHLASLSIPSHDDGEGFLYASDLPRRRVRYFNSLFIESRIGSPMFLMGMRYIMNVLGLPV